MVLATSKGVNHPGADWRGSGRVITGAFALALGILVFIGVISYRSTTQLIHAADAQFHTHLVLWNLQQLLSELVNAETGQRGYLITGETPYLEPYENAVQRVHGTLKTLRTMTTGNADYQRELQALEPLVTAKLSELEETIRLEHTKGFGTARQLVLTNRGKRIMDQIRVEVHQMVHAEDEHLINLSVEVNSTARKALVVLVAGNALSLALLLFAFYTLTQETKKRRRSQESLRRSEERLRTLLEGVKDYAILSLDGEGHVLSWNTGAERINGYRAEEIIGKHFAVFYPPEDVKAGRPEQELATAATEGRSEDEAWRVRKDGTRYWANIIVTPVRDANGEVAGFSKVTRDITERKRAEDEIRRLNENLQERAHQLEISNKELEAFTYSVSHDLRAPLRHIDGFSQLLVEEYTAALPDDAQRYLTRVRDGTRQMGQLVDDLLNLARVGRKELHVEVTGLKSLAEEIRSDLERDAAGRVVKWNIQELPFLECDPGLVKQVFANLLSNALKFTRPRENAVIEVGALEQDGQPVIYVRDNGVGFNMKYADKLFGVFQRLHRQEDFEGTGIGLASVQRIIRKHGGRVWADSALNQGTTFYFTLGKPERPASDNPAAEEVRIHGTQ